MCYNDIVANNTDLHMKMYHALKPEHFTSQIRDGYFIPYWNKLMTDQPVGIWVTESPQLSYCASTAADGGNFVILEIDTNNLAVENTGDWKVKNRNYYIIREWKIPLTSIRELTESEYFNLNWNI